MLILIARSFICLIELRMLYSFIRLILFLSLQFAFVWTQLLSQQLIKVSLNYRVRTLHVLSRKDVLRKYTERSLADLFDQIAVARFVVDSNWTVWLDLFELNFYSCNSLFDLWLWTVRTMIQYSREHLFRNRTDILQSNFWLALLVLAKLLFDLCLMYDCGLILFDRWIWVE